MYRVYCVYSLHLFVALWHESRVYEMLGLRPIIRTKTVFRALGREITTTAIAMAIGSVSLPSTFSRKKEGPPRAIYPAIVHHHIFVIHLSRSSDPEHPSALAAVKRWFDSSASLRIFMSCPTHLWFLNSGSWTSRLRVASLDV